MPSNSEAERRRVEEAEKLKFFQEEIAGYREFGGYACQRVQPFNLWSIAKKDGKDIPNPLKGMFTSFSDCRAERGL